MEGSSRPRCVHCTDEETEALGGTGLGNLLAEWGAKWKWDPRAPPQLLSQSSLAPREALGQWRRFEDDPKAFWCARRYFWFGGRGRSNLRGPKVLIFWVILASAHSCNFLPRGDAAATLQGLGSDRFHVSWAAPGLELQSRPSRPQFHSPRASVRLPSAPTLHPAPWCLLLPGTLLLPW